MSSTYTNNIWSLLGEFYLDTELGDDTYLKTEKLIEEKGYIGIKKLFVEIIAAGGFVHNTGLYAFEWTHLDSKYLLKGWLLTLFISVFAGALYGIGLSLLNGTTFIYSSLAIFLLFISSFVGNGLMHKKRLLNKSNKALKSGTPKNSAT